MTTETKNTVRKTIGNVMLYFVIMIDFALRACYATVYMAVSIFIHIPLTVLCAMVRNKETFGDAISKTVESSVETIRDIFN